jgi:alcohol dehydrogenase, propanol-preferring
MAVGLHRAMGGHSAIVADIDPRKREAAMQAGARLAVDAAAPDAAQQIVEATKGEVCAAIDLVGAVSTARLGMDCLTRKGGKLIIVGLFGGDITLSLPLIPMRALTVQGSYVGSLAEMRALLELVHRQGIPDVPITTRPLALADATLDDLKAGRLVGRAVLEPTD